MQISPVFGFDVRQKLSDITDFSPVIITAQTIESTTKIESEKNCDNEVVMTYVNMEVTSCIKGSVDPSSIITIKMIGGRHGSKGTWHELYSNFIKGEEYLLFLHQVQGVENLWEMKSISSKLPIDNQKSSQKIDCSMLRHDDFYQKGMNPEIDKNMLIERIKGFIKRQGGK